MPEGRNMKNVFKNSSEGNGSVGKPKKEVVEDVEHYLKKMGVRG
jgi:hypothetical protein